MAEALTCEYMVWKLVPMSALTIEEALGIPCSKKRAGHVRVHSKCGKPARRVQFVGDLATAEAVLCDEHISKSNPGGRFSMRDVTKQPPLVTAR